MEVGPVDVYIIGFPGNKFTGRIAPAILELVENGTIRILDLLFVSKDADGVTTVIQAEDLDEDGAAFLAMDVTQPGALGEEDAEEVSDDLPANSSALLVAFENLWAAKLVDALQAADAVVIDSIRIPVDVVQAAIARRLEPSTFENERRDMGLIRMAARTAVVAGTATAVSGRVQRRQAAKYDQQDQQAYDQQQQQQQQYAPPPPSARGSAGGRLGRGAPEPGPAPHPGRADRRGVRRRQGQDPRDLTGHRRERRGVLAAGRGLRRDRRRPLPRRVGVLPRWALEGRRGP